MIKDVAHLTIFGYHGHELCNGLGECAGTVDESHFLGTGRQVDLATQHRMILRSLYSLMYGWSFGICGRKRSGELS